MDSKKLDTFAHKPPIVLAALLLMAIAGFAAVHRLVNRFQSRQRVMAAQIFYRGLEQYRYKSFEAAIEDFRAALSYDPSNYTYELNLAKALIETQRDGNPISNQHYVEAESYLANLAERAPQDGEVNLQLARAAAHAGKTDDSVRYYHRAIYGLWSSDPDVNRRRARLELVDFLLDHDQRMEAQAELIASAASLPPDAALHLRIADRFLRAGDFQSALDQYRLAIQFDKSSPAANRGAGKAAFELGEYRTAQRYLQAASQTPVHDQQAEDMLKIANAVLESDPFRSNLTAGERRRRIVTAFQQAGERAQECVDRAQALANAPALNTLQALRTQWMEMKPKVRAGRVADSVTLDDAMDIVIRIEQTAQTLCSDAQGVDLALLLIARNREGAER